METPNSNDHPHETLSDLIKKYFTKSDARDGEFLLNGEWVVPIAGCDTLQLLIDEVERKQTAARRTGNQETV